MEERRGLARRGPRPAAAPEDGTERGESNRAGKQRSWTSRTSEAEYKNLNYDLKELIQDGEGSRPAPSRSRSSLDSAIGQQKVSQLLLVIHLRKQALVHLDPPGKHPDPVAGPQGLVVVRHDEDYAVPHVLGHDLLHREVLTLRAAAAPAPPRSRGDAAAAAARTVARELLLRGLVHQNNLVLEPVDEQPGERELPQVLLRELALSASRAPSPALLGDVPEGVPYHHPEGVLRAEGAQSRLHSAQRYALPNQPVLRNLLKGVQELADGPAVESYRVLRQHPDELVLPPPHLSAVEPDSVQKGQAAAYRSQPQQRVQERRLSAP
ncbi:hypothetical protein HWI79_3700, partial [Cryptosporidium felis]